MEKKTNMVKHSIDLSAMKEKWSSAVVARTEVKKFSGGIVAPGTLANADCLGEGPEGAFRVGKKVVYPVASLIAWLESRAIKLA
jgi:hypothetical protein